MKDSNGPIIGINQPEAVAFYFTTGSSLNIRGTASDSSTIKYVKYYLSGATNLEGDAVGTVDWQVSGINLLPGNTHLEVMAYDSLLNSGSIVLDITYKAGIYLVDASAKGKNTGTSWADAFTDLQSALAKNILGEVWVAKGTYKPTSGSDRSISFTTQSGVHLYGGFKGGETTREERNLSSNVTIMSGNIGTSVSTDNSYHVVRGASNSTLDGFTISDGYAEEALTENGKGGGIYANGFSPNFLNCTIKNNYAKTYGGGANLNNSLSQFINCIFADNEGSGSGGGGLYAEGNSSITILNSLFIRNKTTNFGGGIYMTATCLMTVKNTLFHANIASYGKNIGTSDGGLSMYNTNADDTFEGGVIGSFNNYGGNTARTAVFMGLTDYRLIAGSPGIDEGVDGPEIPKYDIAGELRPKGKGVDLGPYEQ